MNIELEAQHAEVTAVLPRIRSLVEWARCANAYIDEHNAPPPDDLDDAPRDGLIEAMEELGGLMQRYADSLRGFADREPPGACSATLPEGAGTAGFGTLLQFPTRIRPALTPSNGGADDAARPHA